MASAKAAQGQKSPYWQTSVTAVSIRGDSIRSRRFAAAKYFATRVG